MTGRADARRVRVTTPFLGASPETPEPSAAALPAEIRFLLDVVAAGIGGPPPRPAPGLDWAGVLANVRHHRLEPLMGPASTADAGTPPEWRRDLAAARRATALRTMRMAGELAHLATRFAKAGIDVLALKGPAFSVQLYGGPLRRACRDIDLLVRPEAADAARRLLQGCGYGGTTDAVTLHRNAVGMRHDRNGIEVELHVRLAEDDRLMSTALLRPFDTAVTVAVAGAPVPTLPLEAALAYAAFHGAHHHWYRLHWLADFAAAAGHPDVDWGLVAHLARRTGTERHLALAARLSAALLGRAPPDLLPSSAGRGLAAVRRAEGVVSSILAAPPVREVDMVRRIGRLRILRTELGLHHRPAARWAQLRLRLQPTDTDRSQVPLPRGLGFLHYATRVLRVLRIELGRR